MKKFLLSMGLFSLVIAGKSQTILNELYVQPGDNTNEFFELYYAGTLPIGDNVDCWTLVSYFDNGGADRGVYVMDLPNVSTGFTNRYMVGAASDPFTAQGSSNVVPNFNWNDMPASGRVTKWTVNAANTVWTQQADPVNLQDFFNNKGGGGFNYSALIFVNGAFNNGFLGGSTSSTSAILTSLPALNLTTANSNVCAPFTISWGTLGAMETVISAAGKDNGYNRTSDGQCGAWEKSSSSSEHTPGSTNGPTVAFNGSMATEELLRCNVGPGYSVVNFDVTAISGDISLADDFPVEVQLWFDKGTLGAQDGLDVYQRSKSIGAVADPLDTFRIPQTQFVYIIYRAKRGCFVKVVYIVNGCAPLPVKFSNFTAARNRSNVSLKWATVFEDNSAGFAIERNIRGNWEEIAYVPTQAPGGTSNNALSYEYNDLNDVKGISQYRIRQVDLNTKSSYSVIRAVRGEGQIGKTVVFPNPTSNGKVSVVFEDASMARNVTLVDLTGRVIKQWNNAINNIQIDNLTPGMYSLKIMIPETGEQSVQKIVVTKQ